MRAGRCRNCRVVVRWGALCVDCVRMVAFTVISELVAAGALWAVRSWRR